jgi:hypothetical protein
MLDNLNLETDIYLKMYVHISEQYIRSYLETIDVFVTKECVFLGSLFNDTLRTT